jgi:hypothetical protein
MLEQRTTTVRVGAFSDCMDRRDHHHYGAESKAPDGRIRATFFATL